jgi:hypothetical protein
MNIPLLEGDTQRAKINNYAAAVERLRAEFKKLDPAILAGDVAAAERSQILVTQLQALERSLPKMQKESEMQKRAAQIEATQIRLQANEDMRSDRISVDRFEAEIARAVSVERGWAS